MFKLLKYLKGYTVQCILGPVFKLIETVFELIVPLIVANIIDTGIGNGDKIYILKMCGILALLAVLGLSCALCAQYFAAKAGVTFATRLRHSLFSHIQKLSFSQLDRVGASTLITRLTGDINQIQTGINITLRLLLRSPFVVLGAVVMAFTVDSKAAILFVITVPVLAALVLAVMLLTIPLYRRVQQKLDFVLARVRENLTGTRVIRAFCKEKEEIKEFEDSNSSLTSMQIFVGKISAIMNPATFAVINIAIALLIAFGAIRVELGDLSKGDVVALYNYMSQILIEIIKFAMLVITVTKAIACGNRVQTILETEPSLVSGDVSTGNSNTENIVEFNNVSLAYNNTENALNKINLKIKRGESIGIIGSTGSGKSSLVNLIPRFYDATEGEILVDGVDVSKWNIPCLREKIGVVPQKTALFNGTIRENMQIGKRDATDDEIFAALKAAQALKLVKAKTGVLDFVIEQEGKNLSGGQKQRLAIARAIVKKPEILILDDSSSALDYATAAALWKSIKAADFSPTVITVSQRISAVINADRIVVLDEGELVAVGNNEELLRSCEIYKEIYESQTSREG